VALPKRTTAGSATCAPEAPLYFPSTLAGLDQFFVSARVEGDGGYTLYLDHAKDCFGAQACRGIRFYAQKDTQSAEEQNVKLTHEMTGHYEPGSCGGGCSDPWIAWRANGYEYVVSRSRRSRRGSNRCRYGVTVGVGVAKFTSLNATPTLQDL